ncbi:MAG: hypothetical protein HY819_09285 [Acidobacteria bacterium]|nr:hypothetical protein [Acidobacteriota bacterium]
MFELKLIDKEAIPRSLEKAERYRLLNEPGQAESICLDILQVDPTNQQALIIQLLAITDQFDEKLNINQARQILPHLDDEYNRFYYAGIISERRAIAVLKKGNPGSKATAYDSLVEAMNWYEKAQLIHPIGNEDAALRWNTCARIINHNPDLIPKPEERYELPLE